MNLVRLEDLLVDREVSYGIVQPGSDRPEGTPILRVKDIRNGRIDPSAPMRVDPAIAARFKRTCLRGGEVLLTLVGTVGEAAIVPAELAGWNVARAIAVLRTADVEPEWLSICFRTASIRSQIDAALNTTVQATLNLSDLKRVQIPMPEQRERRAIAEVLGALDDKIAANRKVDTITEALLSSTFDQYVVRGCRGGRLEEIAETNSKRATPQPGGELRYVDIASVADGHYEPPSVSSWDDAPGRARRGLSAGDVVWSTVRPNRRSHALVLDDDKRLVASTGLAVLTPRDVSSAYLYQTTKTARFQQYLESAAEGSAYPAVRADRFADAPVSILSDEDRASFDQLAVPLRDAQHAHLVENEKLATTRDGLLPLLMSGKLRVKDAEKQVGEVL